MTDDRRNPYVILGLFNDDDLAAAQEAFDRRSREARWGDDDVSDVGDLTWALEQIEVHQADPAAAFGTYHAPADPSLLRAPVGYGLLRPAPRPAIRRWDDPAEHEHEREAVFDAARLDAAQRLLDRTAETLGRRLDAVETVPLPTPVLPSPPVRRRGWWPVVAVGVVFLGVIAIAGIRSLTGEDAPADEPVAATTSTTAASPATTVTRSVATTAAPEPQSGFGDAVTVNEISIVPDEPIDAFGHLCILFTVDGDVPLGFVRERVELISGGASIAPALDINTGRAPITDVFGDPAPAVREVCFPIVGWAEQTTDLVYVTDSGNYRWTITGPQGEG
jgi:hypothetical protein